MKQLRQMSILVRGAQLLLLVLALFLVVWLVPDAGKKHASGTEASEAETDGGDVAENEKNRAAGNLEDDGSSAGEVIQDDADENASDVEAALKRFHISSRNSLATGPVISGWDQNIPA